MRAYSLTHLSDASLQRALGALAARDRAVTAEVLAHLAEYDARKLYLPAGYPSMFAYCLGELRFSEDAAYKRIHAARAARDFPALFDAVAEGRLHLTGVRMLAPHLTAGNADELIAAATHRTTDGIERMLATRFPRTDALTLLRPVSSLQHAARQVGTDGRNPELAAGQVSGACGGRDRIAARSAESFEATFTMSRELHDKLQRAGQLLGHSVESHDLAGIFERALDLLIPHLEKRKFAAAQSSRECRASSDPRHIPAPVRRAVWRRDEEQCTFVSPTGHRCSERRGLEFDHILPVARGGRATVDNLRLRCRPHNQFEAERAFGTGFMVEKREAARRATGGSRSRGTFEVGVDMSPEAGEQARDVYSGLRALKVPVEGARRAARYCVSIPDATLEERMRAALRFLCPKGIRGHTGPS